MNGRAAMIAALALAGVALGTVAGLILLALDHSPVPDALISLGSGAVGALAGVIVPRVGVARNASPLTDPTIEPGA